MAERPQGKDSVRKQGENQRGNKAIRAEENHAFRALGHVAPD